MEVTHLKIFNGLQGDSLNSYKPGGASRAPKRLKARRNFLA